MIVRLYAITSISDMARFNHISNIPARRWHPQGSINFTFPPGINARVNNVCLLLFFSPPTNVVWLISYLANCLKQSWTGSQQVEF